MVTSPTIQQELNDLRLAFDEARACVAQGMKIDLSGMDERVRDFCAHVQAADPAIRQRIEPDFAALLAVLNEIENELRRLNSQAQASAGAAAYASIAAKTDQQK